MAEDRQQTYNDERLDALLAKMRRYHPDDNLAQVEKAYHFACDAHVGQKRSSGEEYFTHPCNVAMILAELMLDSATISAGLLHDCVEDVQGVTLETIKTEFGSEVAVLVDGVTKLDRVNFASREEQKAESLRKMFLAMAKDIRVVLIKLADRLHNMRTLDFKTPDRQAAIAQETLDVYAPLAHRLGMSKMKWELEDLSLRYIDPQGYRELEKLVGMKNEEREAAIQKIKDVLSAKLSEMRIKCDIDGRPKHFYSIYKKMKTQNKAFDQIYDLFAVRVIVDTVQDCYAVLGAVHTLWQQVPNRFKDYISLPKGNMYQSLHTTVVGFGGMTFEVQIRTYEMHRMSEYGIAAHWRYKEGNQADELDKKLYWLRQIIDWQSDTRDPNEFYNALKVDLFSDEVLVFTPKGDVKSMPKGATPLDFAYCIHTAVGNKCTGAKVNGRIVPLDSELQSGDFCEIITSSASKGPSRDWLQIVRTSEARTKIRAWFKHEFKDENLEKGKESLEAEAKRLGYQWPMFNKPEYLEAVYKRYALTGLEDLYVMVGFGGLSSVQILNRLLEQYKKTQKPEISEYVNKSVGKHDTDKQHSSSHGVMVEGEPGMLVHFAKCCSPLPGDDIVGYITRGRGVSVHRRDCVNIKDIEKEPERLIHVHWDDGEGGSYNADIEIIAYDRMGLLTSITKMFADMQTNIAGLTAKVDKDGHTAINVTLTIHNAKQLQDIMKALKKRSEILEVFRTNA